MSTSINQEQSGLVMTQAIAEDAVGDYHSNGYGFGSLSSASSPFTSFQVYWSPQDNAFKMYRPTVVSPTSVKHPDPPSVLEFGKTYYCHVKYHTDTGELDASINTDKDGDSSSGGKNTVSLDVEIVKIPPKVISSADDLELHQYHVGTVFVYGGGGGGYPGPFEPVFGSGESAGKIIRIGSGYVPFGRQFKYVSGKDVSLSDGLIVLKVTHVQTSTSAGYSDVVGYDFTRLDEGDISNSESGFTILPLYKVSKGSVVADYRCYLSLAVRE